MIGKKHFRRPEPDRSNGRPRRSAAARSEARTIYGLVDHFDAEARHCTCESDLNRLMHDVTHELGFDYFALLHHASLRYAAAPFVRIDNYPEGWEREMLHEGYVEHDPVHYASMRTNIGFPWSRLGQLLRLSARQNMILERSRYFGIGEGYTVPANVPGEPGGSCSFAVRRGRRLPRNRLLCSELIGAHAFHAARRINGYPAQGAPPRLSRRELECLRLMAAGKTDSEIAIILGLSRETAHQYGKSARAAYDVVSRTQLVVYGLRDARISFDDAIPPSG